MLAEQDLTYHRERARAELDLADRAERRDVAEKHMRLAALHMNRLKLQDEACGGAAVRAAR